jgi:hypothetical protein
MRWSHSLQTGSTAKSSNVPGCQVIQWKVLLSLVKIGVSRPEEATVESAVSPFISQAQPKKKVTGVI